MPTDTKPCRHCRQPIAMDARICQHCQSFQSWLAGQRDPRFQIVWPILLLAMLAGFFVLMQRSINSIDPAENRAAPPNLAVSGTTSKVVPTPEGPRMFALGRVQSTSPGDATNIWFRVSLFDDANHIIDSFLASNAGLIVPGNGSASFRVYGPISASPSEVKRVEVTVEHAKARAKWE